MERTTLFSVTRIRAKKFPTQPRSEGMDVIPMDYGYVTGYSNEQLSDFVDYTVPQKVIVLPSNHEEMVNVDDRVYNDGLYVFIAACILDMACKPKKLTIFCLANTVC